MSPHVVLEAHVSVPCYPAYPLLSLALSTAFKADTARTPKCRLIIQYVLQIIAPKLLILESKLILPSTNRTYSQLEEFAVVEHNRYVSLKKY